MKKALLVIDAQEDFIGEQRNNKILTIRLKFMKKIMTKLSTLLTYYQEIFFIKSFLPMGL